MKKFAFGKNLEPPSALKSGKVLRWHPWLTLAGAQKGNDNLAPMLLTLARLN